MSDLKYASKKVQSLETSFTKKRHSIYLEMYLEYRNDFLTVDRFAEHHGIDTMTANNIIDAGKLVQQSRSKE